MGINVSQFSPPGTVSKLVWDEDMEPGAGKIFKGDLTGDVTGDLTGDMVGNITNGGVNGYLLRSGVVSASSGTLIVPAGSSSGNTPVTISLNGAGTYCIVGNTQKCFYPDPCLIPIVFGGLVSGYESNYDTYAKSYDSDGVLIDALTSGSGDLNIYGASYIVINGGTQSEEGLDISRQISIANAYIDADTTVIPGMIAPPTTGVFTGDVITTYRMTPKTPYSYTLFEGSSISSADGVYASRDNMVLYNVMPNQLLTGSIGGYYTGGKAAVLRFLDKAWNLISVGNLTTAAADFTIPAGTNCIILTLVGNYQSFATACIAKFDIEAV